MPTPADVELSRNVFDSSKGTVPNPANSVYVSPNHGITTPSDADFGGVSGGVVTTNYQIVVDPQTKTQTMYQSSYNLLGQLQKIDPTKVIAVKKGDGKFVLADETKATVSEALADKITNNEAAQATLNNVSNYTIKSALKTEGKSPTPAAVAEVIDAKIENEDETPLTDSDGSQSALTITASNQEKVSSFATGTDDLVYPIGAKGGESDYIKFSALKYVPTQLNTSSGNFGTTYVEGTTIGQSVQLPIQGGIQDSNAVSWNEDNLSALQAAGAEIALNTIKGGIDKGISTFLNQVNAANSNGTQVGTALANSMAGEAVGSNIIARNERAILNPNTELLFQGPQLRAFSFNFKMTPRSADEAKVVKSIIKFFKFHMAPKLSDAHLFLKAPNIFKLEYFQKGQKHSGINLIKDCALQACTVDYTPDGTYMAYDDGSMFSYDLQLQFMELIPLYAKDYNEGDASNHPIGY